MLKTDTSKADSVIEEHVNVKFLPEDIVMKKDHVDLMMKVHFFLKHYTLK